MRVVSSFLETERRRYAGRRVPSPKALDVALISFQVWRRNEFMHSAVDYLASCTVSDVLLQ